MIVLSGTELTKDGAPREFSLNIVSEPVLVEEGETNYTVVHDINANSKSVRRNTTDKTKKKRLEFIIDIPDWVGNIHFDVVTVNYSTGTIRVDTPRGTRDDKKTLFTVLDNFYYSMVNNSLSGGEVTAYIEGQLIYSNIVFFNKSESGGEGIVDITKDSGGKSKLTLDITAASEFAKEGEVYIVSSVEVTGVAIDKDTGKKVEVKGLIQDGSFLAVGVNGVNITTPDFVTFGKPSLPMMQGWFSDLKIEPHPHIHVGEYSDTYETLVRYAVYSQFAPQFFAATPTALMYTARFDGDGFYLADVFTNNAIMSDYGSIGFSFRSVRGNGVAGTPDISFENGLVLVDTTNVVSQNGYCIVDIDIDGAKNTGFSLLAPTSIGVGEIVATGVDARAVAIDIAFSHIGPGGASSKYGGITFTDMVNGLMGLVATTNFEYQVFIMALAIPTRGLSCVVGTIQLGMLYYLYYMREKDILNGTISRGKVDSIIETLDSASIAVAVSSVRTTQDIRRSVFKSSSVTLEKTIEDVRRTHFYFNDVVSALILCVPITMFMPNHDDYAHVSVGNVVPINADIFPDIENEKAELTDSSYVMLVKNMYLNAFRSRIRFMTNWYIKPIVARQMVTWPTIGGAYVVLKRDGVHQEPYASRQAGVTVLTTADKKDLSDESSIKARNLWSRMFDYMRSFELSKRLTRTNYYGGKTGENGEEALTSSSDMIRSGELPPNPFEYTVVIDVDNLKAEIYQLHRQKQVVDVAIIRPNENLLVAQKK